MRSVEGFLVGSCTGNVRTPSIARWKVRGRLPILVFFAVSYGRDVVSGNLSEGAVFRRGMGHFERKFQMCVSWLGCERPVLTS